MGLDIVEFPMNLEDAFNIKIDDHEASEIRTVNDAAILVWAKLQQRDDGTRVYKGDSCRFSCADVLYKVRGICSKSFGVPIDKVSSDSRLKEDLGAW